MPVVSDKYLVGDGEVLLSCDILRDAPFVWKGRKDTFLWGRTRYVVGYVTHLRSRMNHVRDSPAENKESSGMYLQLNLLAPVKLEPYQTKFLPVPIRFNHNSKCYLVDVYIFRFPTPPRKREHRKGTILDSYEIIKPPLPGVVNVTRIGNDRLLKPAEIPREKTRVERLEALMQAQKWDHHGEERKRKLVQFLLRHDLLYILNKKEMGLIQGPLAHIKVTYHQLCRGSSNRCTTNN